MLNPPFPCDLEPCSKCLTDSEVDCVSGKRQAVQLEELMIDSTSREVIVLLCALENIIDLGIVRVVPVTSESEFHYT